MTHEIVIKKKEWRNRHNGEKLWQLHTKQHKIIKGATPTRSERSGDALR